MSEKQNDKDRIERLVQVWGDGDPVIERKLRLALTALAFDDGGSEVFERAGVTGVMGAAYDPSRFDSVPITPTITDTDILNFIEANYDLRGGSGRSLRDTVKQQMKETTP